MLNWLLTAGTDNIPELTGSLGDEAKDHVITLLVGIFIGIIISFCFCKIKKSCTFIEEDKNDMLNSESKDDENK
ncbi:MAG: hypothetical protein IJX92_00385 [Clostridia bacterium]|nr:hypothetical protein [Clostridia bacterium]